MGEMLSAVFLEGAKELITELGGDPAKVAARAHVPVAALSDPGTPVLSYSLTDFFEYAALECDCRTFGLLMAQRSSLAVVGPVWLLLNTAETIGQMVEDLVGNFSIFSEASVIGLEPSDDGLLMSFEGRAGHCESEIQAMEYSLAITCSELRRACPPDWEPVMVQFRHAAPADQNEHHRVFGRNLMFEQDRNTIFVDAATLQQQRQPTVSEDRAKAKSALQELGAQQPASIAARVESAVRTQGDLSDCSLQRLSTLLAVSERTLQRRLAVESTSFKAILETIRADLALKYVTQSGLPLSQISELLGYSELSAFSRAFKRWHSQTAEGLRRAKISRTISTNTPAEDKKIFSDPPMAAPASRISR